MDNQCPHCLGETPPDAAYCLHCGRPTRQFVLCPACHEPIAETARFCSHCTQKIPTKQEQQATEFTAQITASRLGAFLSGTGITSLFRPPRMEVSAGRIQMIKWSFFALRVHHREIRIDRVASVKYTKGVFWGGLLVETFGGASDDISQHGFDQDQARDISQKLNDLINT